MRQKTRDYGIVSITRRDDPYDVYLVVPPGVARFLQLGTGEVTYGILLNKDDEVGLVERYRNDIDTWWSLSNDEELIVVGMFNFLRERGS